MEQKDSLIECGRVFEASDGTILTCVATGDHFCEPRARHAAAFFFEILVHTKGRWSRRRFRLDAWQEHEIIRPLFGWVRWSDEHDRYVRRYTIAWVELGRKNGKSEIAAGIALLLLLADDEEGAELYGAAKDTKQARKVWDVAERMAKISPLLRARLGINKNEKRIFDEATGSFYEVVTRDALGELGHNPHGIIFDEVIAQPDAALWDALRTSMGTRTQPLMLALTTAGNEPQGFAGRMHNEMERIAEDPARAPHVFVFLRNTPDDADPWDEDNWYHANPALGSFLSIEALRQEAAEARNDPSAENTFRQFRLNQWVRQITRWMPLHLWDAGARELAGNPDWFTPQLEGKTCYGGLDLSARFDLTALTWWFPGEDDEPGYTIARYWVPEAQIPLLDKGTGGQFSTWVRDGWITATDGDVIDYQAIYQAIEEDHGRFHIHRAAIDPWSGEPVRQEIETRTGLEFEPVSNTYEQMSPAMRELMHIVRGARIIHGGHPVTRWCMDALEVRKHRDDPDLIKPVKPDRANGEKRIDGAVSLTLAIRAALGAQREEQYAEPTAMYI